MSVCYEKFFYADETGVQDEISQAFEWVFGQVEDRFAKALPGITERAAGQQLTTQDLEELTYFMSVQWLRTPYFRQWFQKIRSEFMKWNLGLQSRLPGFQNHIRETAAENKVSEEELRKAVYGLIESGEYDFRETNNASHLDFIRKHTDEVHICLLKGGWQIILAEEPYHFITSDNPLVKLNTTELFPRGFNCFLALTPSILIEIYCRHDDMNREQQPIDRLSYLTANGKGVLMFNRVLASHAHQFSYASGADEFKQVLK